MQKTTGTVESFYERVQPGSCPDVWDSSGPVSASENREGGRPGLVLHAHAHL